MTHVTARSAVVILCASLCAGSAQDVVLVRSLTGTAGGKSQAGIDRFVGTVRTALDHAGVDNRTVDLPDLDAGQLVDCGLLIFPYNPTPPPSGVVAAVRTFVANGGKLGIFYASHPALLDLVGIERVEYVGRGRLPELGGIRCIGDGVDGCPPFVPQASWNLNAPTPGPDATVLGEWQSSDGDETGFAAVTVHPNGFTVSHVLLNEELESAAGLMLALAGRYVDGLWERAYAARMADAGKIESCANLSELAARVDAAGSRAAHAALRRARAQTDEADRLARAGRYPDACRAAQAAAVAMRDAYLRSCRPRDNELRGVWIHSAYGIADWGWDKTIRVLAENGFNAIFPNMLWGGVADYPSTVLPVHPSVAERGDQIQLCLDACRKYGVEIHVWKVNWNMGHHTPPAVRARFQDERRTQVDLNGEPSLFLAPHLEENFQLERDAMLEVVRRYPVDGIHFDYIRYPGTQCDFSVSARIAFEQWLDAKVQNWPQDCARGGVLRERYNLWRRSHITRLVKTVYEEAHRLRPDVQVSAAVFGDWDRSPNTIAQATEEWIREGWLDFVCPMNYSASTSWLQRILERQMPSCRQIPLYCGIGAWQHPTPARTGEQIRVLRAMGAEGFICFSHTRSFAEGFLPDLHLGATSEPSGLMPHRARRPQIKVGSGDEALEGAYRLWKPIAVEARLDLPDIDRTELALTLTRNGAPAPFGAALGNVITDRRQIRAAFTPRTPGRYVLEVHGSWFDRKGNGHDTVFGRSSSLHVLSTEEAEAAERRTGPPRFRGDGTLRVAVWADGAYGSEPLLNELKRLATLDVAPLYNLAPESLAAARVVVLMQPRHRIDLFRETASMQAVTDYIENGGGVLTMHALVGVRNYVNPAPEIAEGGEAAPGSSWRITPGHAVARHMETGLNTSTFPDRVTLVPGPRGRVVATTDEGDPVVVAGALRRGRYVACGLGVAIDRGDKDCAPSAEELALIVRAIHWLGNRRL